MRLLDRSEELITEFIDQLRLGPDVEWQTVSHPFGFKEEHVENMEELRKLVFMHEGKDDRFWKVCWSRVILGGFLNNII